MDVLWLPGRCHHTRMECTTSRCLCDWVAVTTCGTGAGRGADEPKGGGITMDVEAALGSESQGGEKSQGLGIINTTIDG